MVEVVLGTVADEHHLRVLETVGNLGGGMYRKGGAGLGVDISSARGRGEQALGHARSFGEGGVFGLDQEKLAGPLLDPKCGTLDSPP